MINAKVHCVLYFVTILSSDNVHMSAAPGRVEGDERAPGDLGRGLRAPRLHPGAHAARPARPGRILPHLGTLITRIY